MTDIIFYAQILVFILNIIIFCYLMQEKSFNFKLARIIVLVAISVGAVINFGKVTVFTILFSFTPFLTLIKFNQHGNNKRLGDYIRGLRKYIQKLQGGSKAGDHKVA